MKIAIPVKTNKENPPVAPLFGKAKWFAFVENGNVTIEQNMAKGGQAVIGWLAKENVNAIIFQEMGTAPYELIKAQGGIKLYHSGYERILLDDLLQKFSDNALTELDDAKMAEIIGHHESKH
ncbi:MAG: NifB/NifX family molybdenum-iron cluster-binding protein [Campylobacterota bacterium]|nr:NifB/NifX family molybdenum-iron cluster-binding protein [Campylobacterota bacterium]